jgi:hypothetical protein
MGDGFWARVCLRGFLPALMLSAGSTAGQFNPADLPSRVCADQNCDGQVTPADFSSWSANFQSGSLLADVNDDGVVAPSDYSAWVAAFGQGLDGPYCKPHACVVPATFPTLIVVDPSGFPDELDYTVYEQTTAGQLEGYGQWIDRTGYSAPLLPPIEHHNGPVHNYPGGEGDPPSGFGDITTETVSFAVVAVQRPNGQTRYFLGWNHSFAFERHRNAGDTVEIAAASPWSVYAPIAAYRDLSDAYRDADLYAELFQLSPMSATGDVLYDMAPPEPIEFIWDTAEWYDPNNTAGRLTCQQEHPDDPCAVIRCLGSRAVQNCRSSYSDSMFTCKVAGLVTGGIACLTSLTCGPLGPICCAVYGPATLTATVYFCQDAARSSLSTCVANAQIATQQALIAAGCP